jgi:beta-lactamase superfamily II metal-dependent hydrolase
MENRQKGMKLLEGIESIRSLVLTGDKIHALVDDPQKSEKVIREILKKQGMEILDLLVVQPSLEDAFVSIVSERKSKR